MHRQFLLLAALGACAPSQQSLLAGHHYNEALAGVDEGALDGSAVLSRIAADLAPGLHVQALSAADLRARLPGQPAGLDDVALVRVIHDSNRVSLGGYHFSLVLLHDGAPPPPIDATIEALALRTGETLPEDRTVHHPGTSDYALVRKTRFPLLELFGRVAVNLVTLGTIHSMVPIVEDRGTPGHTATISPSDEEYARTSPAAASLHRWLADPRCEGAGERCERWQLWPRADARRTLAVVVQLSRYPSSALIYQLPLAPGPLEDALRVRFGDRMQTLDELARAAGTRPQVSFPVPVGYDSQNYLTDASKKLLCRLYRGNRRREPLRGRAGLLFTIELRAEAMTSSERQVVQLRDALIACGVPADQIELGEGHGYRTELRVRHDLDAAR
jgi:hypothetical protein